jgi:tRNA pseudouridine55 synthase
MSHGNDMELNGVLVIDKPLGMTSFQVIKLTRRLLNIKKIGHTGTLDPLATGILTLCIGKATKLSEKLMMGHKRYDGLIQLGMETTTYDKEGDIVSEQPVPANLTMQSLQQLADTFTGRLFQVPPVFSAVKHKGQPLYKLARKGIFIQKNAREIEIFSFVVTSWEPPVMGFSLHCSKGTYVRTLAHDFGQKLGCGACLARLHRTQNGIFHMGHAVSMDDIRKAVSANTMDGLLISQELLDITPELSGQLS